MLTQADKEGGFAVLPEGTYNEKALVVVNKNFVPVKKSEVCVKTEFAEFCKRLDLGKLARDISNSRGNSLRVVFTAKTHKPEVPFRTIVSDEGSWQKCVSQFLLKKLKTLVVNDPFLVKKSATVAQFLERNDHVAFSFSVDVQDLFYSVPRNQLLVCVKECI